MSGRMKTFFFLILLIAISILLFGCWDNRDITKRGFVAAIGLDKGEDDSIELTLQIVNPSSLQTNQNGGGSNQNATWVHSSKGDTIFEAIRNQLRTTSRRPYYSHMQIMVIGEELAKEGITDILDIFERDPELRLTFPMLIAKDTTAKSILELKSQVQDIPAVHLTEILDNNEALGETVKIQLFEMLKKIRFTGLDSTIGSIENINQQSNFIKDIDVTGAAVFKGDKLIGWLGSMETRGHNFVIDKIQSTIINIPNPLDNNKLVAIEEVSSNGKMDVEYKDNKLLLKVEIDALGNIGAQDGKGNLATEEMLRILEEECEAVIREEISSAINKAQKEFRVDFFGFCKIVNRKYPEYWKAVKSSWREEFSKSKVSIDVHFDINRTGVITKNIQVN